MFKSIILKLTILEWLIIVAIVITLVALLLSQAQGVSDGDFQLHLSFTGTTPADHRFRVAVGYGHEPEKYLNVVPMPYLNWQILDAWDGSMLPIRCSYSYKYKTDWLGRIVVPASFPRVLIAEYTAPNEPPRYRVILFERRRHQKIVELTVSREPPSDDEAWKPGEITGR